MKTFSHVSKNSGISEKKRILKYKSMSCYTVCLLFYFDIICVCYMNIMKINLFK